MVDTRSGRRPDVPEPQAEAGRQVRLFALLLVALVLVSGLPLPVRLAGLAFGAGAVWVAIRALGAIARVRATGGTGRGQLPVSIGLGLVAVICSGLAWDAATFRATTARENCLAGANTRVAREACDRTHPEPVEDLLRRLTPTPR